MKTDPFQELMEIIERLTAARIAFEIRYVRESSLQVEAFVPGQHWEIDVHADGTVDFEVFQSPGNVSDKQALLESIEKFSD